MNEKQKKYNRFSYLEYYTRDENGNYVYTGKYCRCLLPAVQKKKVFTAMILLWVLAAACFIGCGMLPQKIFGAVFYVVLAYAAEFAALVFILYTQIRLMRMKDPMKEYEHKETAGALPTQYVLAAISGILTFIAEACYLFFVWKHDAAYGAAALILQAVFIAACILLYPVEGKLAYETIEKDAP